MAGKSRVHGYVEEAWPGAAGGGIPAVMARLNAAAAEISRHNEDMLQSLPLVDDWPLVCRPMVAWPAALGTAETPAGCRSPITLCRNVRYFSRNRSDGFSTVTIVFGGTLLVSETLAPIAEFAPITVSPPRIVALA